MCYIHIVVEIIKYLRDEMANVFMRKSIRSVSSLPQSAIEKEHFYHTPDLLANAVHIYASIPYNTTHALTVELTVVPFRIPIYRDQIFYYVDASYSKCCYEIEEEDFMLFLSTSTEELYRHYMSHHSWNFRTQHSWLVHLPVNLCSVQLTEALQAANSGS
jgi:hypothetical protein